ncbi:MAG TPA: hypothetical protein VG992_04760 [Candidatus Saccharimonadales bacterium]|nr:hypothetical protein [Candidatus Saccharimonadales bacterium]
MNYPEQSVSNVVAKGGSAAELSKWCDAQVDPELLSRPIHEETPIEYDAAQRPIGFAVAAEAGRLATQHEFITWDSGLIGT